MPDIQASPPLRADARRNRDALLVAARAVFAEEGLDAPLDAIAKQAGVGRATLYRRFPTRDTLITAIFDADFDALAEVAEQATDPGRVFFDVIEAAMAMQHENLGFIELWTRRQSSPELIEQAAGRFGTLLGPALAAAQKAGLVRADLTLDDTGTILLMVGAATANHRGRPDGERLRQRTINLLLDAIDPVRAPRALDT